MGEYAEADKKLFGLDRGQRLIVEAVLTLWITSVFVNQMGIDLERKATFILVFLDLLVFHPFLTGNGIFTGVGRSFMACAMAMPVAGVLAFLEKFVKVPFIVLAILGVTVCILLPAFFYLYQIVMTVITLGHVPIFRKITGVIGIFCGFFIVIQGVQCIPFLYTEVLKEESDVRDRKADRDWVESYLESKKTRGVPDMGSVDFSDAITESAELSDTTFKIQAPITIDAVVDHQKGKADATAYMYVYKTVRGEEAKKLCNYLDRMLVIHTDDEEDYEYLFLQTAYRAAMGPDVEPVDGINLDVKIQMDSVDGKYDKEYYTDSGKRLVPAAELLWPEGQHDSYFMVRVPKEAMEDYRLRIEFENVTVTCPVQ